MVDINPEQMKKVCVRCGKKLEEKTAFCPGCGLQVEVEKKEEQKEQPKQDSQTVLNNTVIVNNVLVDNRPEKDKWIALILCFLLGAFGVHKFYEGKTGLGIFYIIMLMSVFLTPILGICVFVDFIVILFKPNPYRV